MGSGLDMAPEDYHAAGSDATVRAGGAEMLREGAPTPTPSPPRWRGGDNGASLAFKSSAMQAYVAAQVWQGLPLGAKPLPERRRNGHRRLADVSLGDGRRWEAVAHRAIGQQRD